MIIKNSYAILILGFIFGIATNLNFIGSQAYLLSRMIPVYALYISTASGIIFTLFLNRFFKIHRSFSYFSLFSIVVYAFVLALLNMDAIPGMIRAALWFFLAVFGIAFFRWMANETTIRYLDPARAQSHFSYLITAFEIGIIFSSTMFKLYGNCLTENHIIWLSTSVFGLAIAIFGLQFCPSSNIEIHFTSKHAEAEGFKEERLYKRFIRMLIIVSIFLGAFKVCEEYLIKVALKESLGSYENIAGMIANYMLISSIAILTASSITGKVVRSKHLSPMIMMGAYVVVLLGAAIATTVERTLFYFVALEVVRRGLEHCFFMPSKQMTISAFVGQFRNRLLAAHNFYYYTAIPIPFIVFFSFPFVHNNIHQKSLVLGMIIICLAVSLYFLYHLSGRYKDILYSFARSANKTAAVIAVQALSFLKPSDYEKLLLGILKLSPKKVLRKNIILSLAYSHKESMTGAITKEFESDKEEIQMAVLDALNISKNFKSVQFMLHVIRALEKPKSLRVRINATAMIAAIYGKKAVPFLLDGLDDPDARVVANTLETLSTYHDKKLIPIFLRYLDNETARVKANALLGLSHFRSTRDLYRKEVLKILKGKDPNLLSSILFVVGNCRDKYFYDRMIKLRSSPLFEHENVRRNLAWALLQTGHDEGFEIFDLMLVKKIDKEEELTMMHHFSLMSREMRFDIVKYLARQHVCDDDFIEHFGAKLKSSKYDFHEELEYFNLAVAKLKKQN